MRDTDVSARWRIVTASVTGTKHETNEDALLVRHRNDGTLFVAIADGASSATRGSQGAGWATQAAVDWLHEQELESDQLQATLTAALRHAHEFIADQDGSIADFDCTLLLAVITPSHAAFAQVGDGFIIGDTGEPLKLLTQPFKGEYVNVTKFITEDDYESAMSVAVVESSQLSAIMLMSDGLERVLVRQGTNDIFETPCRQLLDFARRTDVEDHQAELQAWLRSEAISDHNGDDKTLVLIVPAETVV